MRRARYVDQQLVVDGRRGFPGRCNSWEKRVSTGLFLFRLMLAVGEEGGSIGQLDLGDGHLDHVGSRQYRGPSNQLHSLTA